MGGSMSGAMDANAFRRCSLSDTERLPQPESITWEGVLHEHYYETGTTAKRVEPSFSLVNSPDPLSGREECWLTLGLNSCYDGPGLKEKGRLPCNIVFVIDVSGSMKSGFSRHFNDGRSGVSKLRAAKDAVIGMLPLLHADDAVAILAFDTQCTVEATFTHLSENNAKERLQAAVSSLEARGGTCFMAGFDCAMKEIGEAKMGLLANPVGWTPRINEELPSASRGATKCLRQTLRRVTKMPEGCVDHTLSFLNVCDIAECGGCARPLDVSRRAFTETRIFFMTDMNINQGNRDADSLMNAVEGAATNHGVMTTIIGIGVDFDVALTDRLACVRGANYFTVHSTDEFLKQMTEEVDYLMAPLAYDLKVEIDTGIAGDKTNPHVLAVQVYGAPEPAKNGPRPAGTLARINSFFPSSMNAEGQTKGSVILCRLNHAPPSGRLSLTTSYSPRTGDCIQRLHHQTVLQNAPEAGALKGIALVRYVNAVRSYLSDMKASQDITATSSINNGIRHPSEAGADISESMPRSNNKRGCKAWLMGPQTTDPVSKKAMYSPLDPMQKERIHKTLATTYSEVFAEVGRYLQDVESKLQLLGDTDTNLSPWSEKVVELREGCVKCMSGRPDVTQDQLTANSGYVAYTAPLAVPVQVTQ